MNLLLAIILASLVVLVIALFSPRGRRDVNVAGFSCVVMCCLAVGSFFVIATERGFPFIEWMLPMIVMVTVSIIGRSHLTVMRVASIEIILAVFGVWQFSNVTRANGEYAVASQNVCRVEAAVDRTWLHIVQNKLKSHMVSEKDDSPRDISELVESRDRWILTGRRYHAEWHTWFSRLSHVELYDRAIWLEGGLLPSTNSLVVSYRDK